MNKMIHIAIIITHHLSKSGKGKATLLHTKPAIVHSNAALGDLIPPTALTIGLLIIAPQSGPVIAHKEYQKVTYEYDAPIISRK